MDLNYQELLKKAETLKFANKAFINGKLVAAVSGKTFPCISPRDGKVLTDVASCDEKDVNFAVESARKAFNSGVWSNLGASERKKTLLKFADLLEKHALELALLETLDMGKPISNSYNDDILGAIEKVRWVAEAIDKIYDQIAPTDPNLMALITREPCGVIGCVTPWNFPLYLACSKIMPAIAVGNSVVLKPAEQSPLTTLKLAELIAEAGIPEGVVNVLPGFGETAGKAIGMHPDIDVVSFTGSTEVGRYFLRYSAESNMKRIHLECGGKSPNIILADSDLEEAARAACRVFYNQGEVCCAPTRLLVDKKIQQQVISKLNKYSDEFQPGDPLDPKTTMGAMVDETQLKRVLKYIDKGKKEGAALTKGGNQVKKESGGYYIEPTIFTDVQNDMLIAREEIFGPVLTVLSFDNIEEAIKIANDTHYGLASFLWTNDINKALTTAKALRAGTVSINTMNTVSPATPFGGYKQSGMGREGSLEDFNNYSETKTTWIGLK